LPIGNSDAKRALVPSVNLATFAQVRSPALLADVVNRHVAAVGRLTVATLMAKTVRAAKMRGRLEPC
jgi:5,10-methylene-tetrahydrofolate dehydrogenase/methenyl tetrahydrofolate cyclohydrolase